MDQPFIPIGEFRDQFQNWDRAFLLVLNDEKWSIILVMNGDVRAECATGVLKDGEDLWDVEYLFRCFKAAGAFGSIMEVKRCEDGVYFLLQPSLQRRLVVRVTQGVVVEMYKPEGGIVEVFFDQLQIIQ